MGSVIESAARQLKQCQNCHRWEGSTLLCEFSHTNLAGDCMKFISTERLKRVYPNVKVSSDGSTASYYVLPAGAAQLQDLISHRNMNAQMGEIFRATYRYGLASHSDQLRDAKKIKFYIEAEIARLEKLGGA